MCTAESSHWPVCEEGFYNNDDSGVECVRCILGTRCQQAGVTRHSLPLLRGWWRPNSSSTQVYQCPDGTRENSGCIGGTGPLCKEHLQGPYCQVCNDSDVRRFYDRDVSECSACSEKLAERMAPSWVVLASGLALLLAAPRIGPSVTRTVRRRIPRLLTKWAPLKDKLRIVWGSFQIIYQVPTIYQLSLPASVTAIIESFTPIFSLGIDFLTTIPLECVGLGGFRTELVVYMLLPILVLGVTYPLVVSAGPKNIKTANMTNRASHAQRAVGRHFRQGLPLALLISFLAFPIVSTKAFQAFPIERVGGIIYLKADYRVTGGSSRHTVIKAWASVAILLYPLGIPLLYGYLLYKVRGTLQKRERSPLSSALAFLHRPFKPKFFWWELVLVAQKLILVGLFVLNPFRPGTSVQLTLGTAVSFIFMAVQMQVQPYRRRQDNTLATVTNISLYSFFVAAGLYRSHELTSDYDAVNALLTSEWASGRFTLSSTLISTLMLLSFFGSLIAVVVLELLEPLACDFFCWELDGSPVVPPLLAADQFHTFLSHNWATGQVGHH